MNTCRYCGQLTTRQDGCEQCNLLADAIAEEARRNAELATANGEIERRR